MLGRVIGPRLARLRVHFSGFRPISSGMTPTQAPAGHASAYTEERFKELIGTVDAIVSEYDLRAQRFTYVSEQSERILGYTAEQLASDGGFWPSRVHEDDRERIEQVTAE